jgi:hypothetical protein
VGPLLASIGLVLLLAGAVMVQSRLLRVWGWSRARAEVVGAESARIERIVGKLIECRRVYFYRYRFQDVDGCPREFTDTEARSVFCPDSVGVVLPVRYNPSEPNQAVVWEFWVVWLVPLACLFGALPVLATAHWLW